MTKKQILLDHFNQAIEETNHLPDIQKQQENFLYPISHVGIKNFKMPITLYENGENQHSIADIQLTVSLNQYERGTHMSRFVEILQDSLQHTVSFNHLKEIVTKVKDEVGSEAFHKEGIIQRATQLIKRNYSDFLVIADTCICQYTTSGHCGIYKDGKILNDESLKIHNLVALSQAAAGVDIVAPSSMMDGFVSSIRTALDHNGFENTPIMSYGVKYSSAFYGPFRDAAENAPSNGGTRDSYQMNPANRLEALRELKSDTEEGADFIIVKPALAYLDIIRDLKNRSYLPIVAYQVSGEYSMVKAAAMNGWIEEKKVIEEILISTFRAGADAIITYFAKDYVKWQKGIL